MEEKEIKALITTFKEYRDLIGPIEQSLKAFSVSFDSIREDIANLNSGFDGSLQSKLDKIYKELSSQADKAKTLSGEVDKFMTSTTSYIASVDNLIKMCASIEDKLKSVEALENKAESQIEKLNGIIEEKRKSYDIRALEKNLETYNIGVEKISDYINKDVADVLRGSSEKIDKIRDTSGNIFEAIINEKGSIEKLLESYEQSNKMLKKIVENEEVNKQYIFEILDKWADERKLKIKKPD